VVLEVFLRINSNSELSEPLLVDEYASPNNVTQFSNVLLQELPYRIIHPKLSYTNSLSPAILLPYYAYPENSLILFMYFFMKIIFYHQ